MVQKQAHLHSTEPDPGRAHDPNVEQRRASNPASSVWVGASAGTGKTKVLTERVLRLMLPREDGQPGTPPHKILGITFTRAGASEMALRINETLGKWAVMPPEILRAELGILLQREAGKSEQDAARRLFADVVDTPGGLKIMTIHAFCQSVLSRFPLEAGLPPYFRGLEEAQASQLLARARDHALREAESDPAAPLGLALQHVAATVNEEQFLSLIGSITAERGQFLEVLRKYFNADGLYTAICANLNLTPGQTPDEIALEACHDSAFDYTGLLNAAKILARSTGKKEPVYAATIADWLAAKPEKRLVGLADYRAVFLTTKGEAREKDLPTTRIAQTHPDCIPILRTESDRLIALQSRLNAATCALLTRDLFCLGEAVLSRYTALKRAEAALDFDDLILTTVALLEGRTQGMSADKATAWVLYKLDQGIDHILIDEAQDTNPEQWKIIKALCEDFFTGTGAHEHERTVFAVGDEKQSIYSFQRASPEEFTRMYDYFEERIHQAEQKLENVDLNISFRSAPSILQAVDATFAAPEARKGLGLKDIAHHSYHYWRAGHVELWPLYETHSTGSDDFWSPPTTITEGKGGAAQLADKIAETIDSWLKTGEELPSYGRPIQPGDIMILVRTRTAFFTQLARALKTRNIPVSGVDRMILGEQLVVQDLRAMAEFSLLPGDNLTLACILKSPLIGMSEETLFELAHNRASGQSLWAALNASTHTVISSYLSGFITRARDGHPYEFFSQILQLPCPADPVSGLRAIKARLGDDAIDPLDELLSMALDFEAHNIPSLQGFLHWQSHEQTEVKRQLSEHTSQVRIMTVHGSKGLQAPIVILPDTVRASMRVPGQAGRRLIWPDKSDLDFPLWSPRAEFDFSVYKQAAAIVDDRSDEEYRRLLYVAMTRAEDQLYICGYKGTKAPLPTSWYNYVEAGLKSIPEATEEEGIITLENKQTRASDRKPTNAIPTGTNGSLPAWLFEAALPEAQPAAVLRPSRPLEEEQAAISPGTQGRTHRFRRGNLTHKLLQLLPTLPPALRVRAAETFISRYGADLSPEAQTDIIKETLAVLAQPEFADLFGPGSQAEVPITGQMPDGQIISGQIDRLLIKPDEILIIDYKTNRPPPFKPEDVPEIYRRQMQAYATALRLIYPGRTVRAALLWTDGPHLMAIGVD